MECVYLKVMNVRFRANPLLTANITAAAAVANTARRYTTAGALRRNLKLNLIRILGQKDRYPAIIKLKLRDF
jgi:hypothetical protein